MVLSGYTERCEAKSQDQHYGGQVDSPELPETTENFTKVTKYLTKFQETLINYGWGKSHVKKQLELKFSVASAFSNMLYGKKRKPGNAGNQQKAFSIQKAPTVNLLSFDFNN